MPARHRRSHGERQIAQHHVLVERERDVLQDAFYVPTHEAVRRNGSFAIVPSTGAKDEDIDFIMLKDGAVYFEGHAAELPRTNDAYLKTFLSDWFPPLIP
jgi:hypothetical protein